MVRNPRPLGDFPFPSPRWRRRAAGSSAARARPANASVPGSGTSAAKPSCSAAMRCNACAPIAPIPRSRAAISLTPSCAGLKPVRVPKSVSARRYEPYLLACVPSSNQGSMRLAVGASARLSVLPHTPTLAELGYPAANLGSVFAIFAPPLTPQPLVQRLSRLIDIAVREPVLLQRLIATGNEALGGTPAELAERIEHESAQHRELLQANPEAFRS